MENTIKNHNASLHLVDIAKFFCALSVIGIHTQIFSSFGELADYYSFGVLFRLSVAFFFICSGYFFFSKLQFENGKIINSTENKNKLSSYVKRIAILYIIWSAVYFVLQLIQWIQNPDIPVFHFIISFVKSFIIDGSYYHLWYILCLIYAIPLIYIMLRKFSYTTVSLIAILLYIIHLLINLNDIVNGLPVISLIAKINAQSGAIGQTVFLAIPMIAIGGYLANSKQTINKKTLIFTNILSIILLVVEASLIYFISGKTNYSEYIIFTFITVVAGFMLLKEINHSNKHSKLFYLLRNMSTLIYCIHPLIIVIFKTFVNNESINSVIWFAIVSASTLVVSLLIILISKKLKFLKYCY
ncbi:MAG: acyltransferase [Clostridium sp.]|nr:acyltransferase [Clostridium sp.]